jgi:hypothetical protein
MSSHNFLTVADELEALLKESKVDPTAPQIDESYLVAAKPVESPEAQAATEHDELIPDLVRTIVDYAVRSAPAGASAKNIGEAIGQGVSEAVHQLKLDDVKVVNALDVFLKDLSGAVRSKLRMG